VLQSLPTRVRSPCSSTGLEPGRQQLYAAAGGNDKIRVYTHTDGLLTEAAPITLAKGSFPSGLAVSSDGSKLFVADTAVVRCPPSTRERRGARTVATVPPVHVGLTGDGRTAYV